MTNALSQQGSTFEFDVIVIGTGLAGLHYCLQLLAKQPQLKIALLSKTETIESNSRYAQGGIASVFTGEDSVASHINDLFSGIGGKTRKPRHGAGPASRKLDAEQVTDVGRLPYPWLRRKRAKLSLTDGSSPAPSIGRKR